MVVRELSYLGLNLDAARNAVAYAGLTLKDVDGVATAGEHPWSVASSLGIPAKWVDALNVGGSS